MSDCESHFHPFNLFPKCVGGEIKQKLFTQAYCYCSAEGTGMCGALYCIALYYMHVGGSCFVVKIDASMQSVGKYFPFAKQLPGFHISIIKESHKLNWVNSKVKDKYFRNYP